jgi:hypothetical protein
MRIRCYGIPIIGYSPRLYTSATIETDAGFSGLIANYKKSKEGSSNFYLLHTL